MRNLDIAARHEPPTRDQWLALRRIRRLQILMIVSLALVIACFLAIILFESASFRAMAATGQALTGYWATEIWELVCWAILFLFACAGALAITALNRSTCPRCHEAFFVRAVPGHLERRAHLRKWGNFSQTCVNCGLSLGWASLPPPLS
jgi:hypothetical protein